MSTTEPMPNADEPDTDQWSTQVEEGEEAEPLPAPAADDAED